MAGCATLAAAPGFARAETLEQALVQAYMNNPSLNSQRAAVRATDEGVPQALSGYRPKVTITATGGQQSLSSTNRVVESNLPANEPPNSPATYATQSGYNTPVALGATITQTLFNGFQTASKTRQAESQVFAARATLRVTEQTVLLNAATAYMNLLRDTAILDLQRRNVEVLQEQLRQTRDRFNVGEVTRTDVAQAESRLAAGRSQVLSAEATYKASVATYRQVIGVNPGKLTPGTPVDRFSPNALSAAIGVATATHPSVATAEYNVDVAIQAVKVAEASLYPTVSVTGNYTKNYEVVGSLNTVQSYQASVLGTVSVPIYQGGAEYSLVRQAKETLGQRRLDLDTARDQVRQTTVQSWGQLEAAKATVDSTQAQVQAAEIALNGVREEARVGQRTTLDVLNAQQELVNARVALVSAQRDRVVASYTLLAAVGRLSPEVLGLHVPVYQPQVHYQQVRDSWAGLRNPDGR
ncbi:MAG TPA: TolC family outer membrane protein [Pseudolabrys sp.]|nr:TolC family outer membrane protein [Pseudolabrys sp.]